MPSDRSNLLATPQVHRPKPRLYGKCFFSLEDLLFARREVSSDGRPKVILQFRDGSLVDLYEADAESTWADLESSLEPARWGQPAIDARTASAAP